MTKPQYAIMRFAKYKGPEISGIEAHNERTKEKYASNPDIDPSRTHLNYHLITPTAKYRASAERQIADAGCKTRTDSVRLVEVLITGSPEFFKGKNPKQTRRYFEEALAFLKQYQREETFVSAVVHMDEKTPHMHVTFVPLTQDNRLCAKEIIGNKKKLTAWQDAYWQHMAASFPELERGESASLTGRDHIPPRVFKEMSRLTKLRKRIEATISDASFFNAKGKLDEVHALLDDYIPSMETMNTLMKRYKVAFTDTKQENAALHEENEDLTRQLEAATKVSVREQLQQAQIVREYEKARQLLERIPPEVIKTYTASAHKSAPMKESITAKEVY